MKNLDLNLIQEIAYTQSLNDLKKIILKALNNYNLNDFNYGIKVPSIIKNEQPYIFSGYAKNWIEHYTSNNYHKIDSTVLYSFKNITPIIWDDFHFMTSKKLRDESKDAGLINGVTYPIHGASGEKGLFCIAGREEISPETFVFINMLVPHVHHKILDLDLKSYEYFL